MFELSIDATAEHGGGSPLEIVSEFVQQHTECDRGRSIGCGCGGCLKGDIGPPEIALPANPLITIAND